MLIENNGSMSDKERLENIKYEFEAYRELSESDEKWLIQQAEKVEQLEMELQIHKELYNESYMLNTSKNVKIGEHLNKIERYEKVLEFYANEEIYNQSNDDYFTGYPPEVINDRGWKAKKALKG